MRSFDRHSSFALSATAPSPGRGSFSVLQLALHYSLQQLLLPSLALYLHGCKAIPLQHHGLVFEIFFISVVIGICGAEHLIPAALLLCQLCLIPARVRVLMPFLLHSGLLPLVSCMLGS